MVGKSILNKLKSNGFKNLIFIEKKKLNLLDQKKVYSFLKHHKPDAVIIAAAKVGGIIANNKYRADFIYQNLSIQNNLIHGSYLASVKHLIFLGSSCIFPKHSKQPIKEKYLLSGALERTNEPYAIAKIAGLKLCEAYNHQYGTNYKCLMPCNLYGPGDNYDQKYSHFFPALINKIHKAKINKKKHITLWGTGTPMREIMYVDDLANAIVHFLKIKTNHELINIGSGFEMSIKQYAEFLIKELKMDLSIKFDFSKPNGTPRKIIDSSLANNYGWYAKVSLKNGFKKTYKDYLNRY